MTTADYLPSAALVLIVVRQLRGRRLAGATLYVPLALVAYACAEYLRAIPTAGNDLVLVVACLAGGLTLGVLCGAYTLVYADRDGVPFVRATGIAATLRIAGVSGRRRRR